MFRRNWIRRLKNDIIPPDRDAISAQYWRDLNQLLNECEITLDIARRIEGDMFEAASPGRPRRLNDRAWNIILDGHRAQLDRVMMHAGGNLGSAV